MLQALRALRSKAAAFLDRHASDWRYVHRMWSVWLLIASGAVDAAYANIYVLHDKVDPITFIELTMGINALAVALRVLNQKDVPSA